MFEVWVKELCIFDLKLGFCAKNHPEGQDPRSRVAHPGQTTRKLMSYLVFSNWLIGLKRHAKMLQSTQARFLHSCVSIRFCNLVIDVLYKLVYIHKPPITVLKTSLAIRMCRSCPKDIKRTAPKVPKNTFKEWQIEN